MCVLVYLVCCHDHLVGREAEDSSLGFIEEGVRKIGFRLL